MVSLVYRLVYVWLQYMVTFLDIILFILQKLLTKNIYIRLFNASCPLPLLCTAHIMYIVYVVHTQTHIIIHRYTRIKLNNRSNNNNNSPSSSCSTAIAYKCQKYLAFHNAFGEKHFGKMAFKGKTF